MKQPKYNPKRRVKTCRVDKRKTVRFHAKEDVQNRILDVILKNPNSDSVDIVTNIGLRADIVMYAIGDLQDAGKIKRVSRGMGYVYELI